LLHTSNTVFQKPKRGANNQKGGGTFLKYSIGCMQQPGSKT